MWQKLVKDHPLVVPQHQATGLDVSIVVWNSGILRSNEIHCVVMKQKTGRMQPGDHDILIIAWVTNDRCIIGWISRQILVLTATFDPKFDWIIGIV